MKRQIHSIALSACLGIPLVALSQTPGVANVAELARAQATSAELTSQHARKAAEHARIEAERARERSQFDDEGTSEDAESEPANVAEALAIDALEGLIAAPPERALPRVRKVLSGSQSDRVKRRAIFVLGLIDVPEAGELLAETARKSRGALQREAIRSLGIRGGQAQSGILQSIWQQGDARTRDAVVEAFAIAGDKAALVAIAQSVPKPADARAAIEALAAMGAVSELRELGRDGKLSAELMQAFAVTGDLDGLVRIARSEQPLPLRSEAVRSIGIVGGDEAHAALRDLYRDATDDTLRSAALEGLMISADERGILALYRAESDPARKRELLRMLTVIGGDAAFEAIDAALDGKSP